jgi:uncharacterized protein YndB with AHSA1/START domain
MSTLADSTTREVHITRDFKAPRHLVFKAWSDAVGMTKWYAPNGCSIAFKHYEFRPGGRIHSCITTPDGHECWCIGDFREIREPERIVYTMAIGDKDGNAADPKLIGMDPEWPAETLVTVTLTESHGTTTLTLHQTVSEALAKRTGAHPSWLQMLDRLAGQLAAASPL